MATITAILEPDPDGTLHLPLPIELQGSKVKVTATLEPAPVAEHDEEGGTPLEAFKELRKAGAFREIADPVAWQREIRRDRSLPGRD